MHRLSRGSCGHVTPKQICYMYSECEQEYLAVSSTQSVTHLVKKPCLLLLCGRPIFPHWPCAILGQQLCFMTANFWSLFPWRLGWSGHLSYETLANIHRACVPADICKQHVHHRAVTFPEVSDGRRYLYYLLHRAELKTHHSHLNPDLNFRCRHGYAVGASAVTVDL